MFMNLHSLSTGQAMYTLAVTGDPATTPRDEVEYDEVDYVAPTRLTAREVVRSADAAGVLLGYEHCRVVGVVNQSDAYVMWEDPAGDLRAS